MIQAEDRAAFAAALARLRASLPDVSDEALARRASAVVLPSGRRAAVDARRLGEWLSGRAVPRQFEQVFALIAAVGAATGSAAAGLSVEQWRRLWRAAKTSGQPQRSAPATSPAAVVVAGRPPSDAAALREREPLAAAIDAALWDDGTRQVLLTGPGGAGKSQLAAAAFHRARRRGGGTCVWVPASSRQSVLSGYARAWRLIAAAGDGGYGHDEETQADLFVAWLRSGIGDWLVVLDDVDEPADLDGLWPAGERGRIVVTSRRREAALIRPPMRVITVGMFAPEESVAYLRDRLSAGAAPPGERDLANLADALGHFPLALAQAAAYLIDTGTGLPDYRRLVGDQRERLADLLPPAAGADGHDRTVASTWQVSLRRAEALAPPGTARRMIELAAMLAPEGVPDAVLLGPAAGRWIGGAGRDALLALRALHRLSLVTHEAPAVAMHALVQRAVREAVADERSAGPALAAADALEEAWAAAPGGEARQAALFDSTEALRRHAGERLWSGGMHPVLRRAGDHLVGLGRAAAARDHAETLLRTARAALGDGHRDTLFLTAQAAQAVGELGDASSAYARLARVRLDAERLLGPRDADTLAIRLHEARHRMETGAAGAALDDLTALAADVAGARGADDPVARKARELAALCRGLSGDPAGARDAYAEVVAELTERLGPRHPDTVGALSGLGRWIGEAGDTQRAVDVYVEAVAGLEAASGRLHHETIIARHNLAYWRGLAGQLPLAVEEFAVAAGDAERALGPRHPTTLTFRANLAYWRGLAGAADEGAAELAALQPTVDEVLGASHPRALRTRRQRAELLHRRGDAPAAIGELAAALATMREVLGDEHAHTREGAELLAGWRAASPA